MAFLLLFALLPFIFSSLVASYDNSTNDVIVMHYEVRQDLTVVVFPSLNTTDVGKSNEALLNESSARRQNFRPDFRESFNRELSFPSNYHRNSAPHVCPNQVPQLELVDAQTYCFGNAALVQLGPCSSTFLKCNRFTQQSQYQIEECPLGYIFVRDKCHPAYEVRGCFNTEANSLNDATEKLAKATHFCTLNPFGAALYTSAQTDRLAHKCSRQALLCRSVGDPLAISCVSDQVFDTRALKCVKAPERCFFVSNKVFAPIRANLLRFYCDMRLPESLFGRPGEPVMRDGSTEEATSSENLLCRSWYVACLAPTLEVVFCGEGKVFDVNRRQCRHMTAEDQCPVISSCNGWEWRTVALGECRNDFLYCNGLRPTIFQCQEKDAVFKNGECVRLDPTHQQCGICRFLLCTHHEITKNPYWQDFRCDAPRLFSPFTKECVSPTDYQCPNQIECREGDSFPINCAEFLYCYEGNYVSAKCPHMTRWDVKQRRCIADSSCRQFKQGGSEDTKTQCQSGETHPSTDCETFEECINGKFVRVSCHEFSLGRLKAPCRFCSDIVSKLDTYLIDTILPKGFNPFDSTQVVRKKQCTDGEKMVNVQDCGHYMECVSGEWINMECPKGFSFSPKQQGCVNGGRVDCRAMKQHSDFSDVQRLRPLYSPNETLEKTLMGAGGGGNGAGPTPAIPWEFRKNYMNTFEFCDHISPKKMPHSFDCSKYKECAETSGGYYLEKQCPHGSQFDPLKQECDYDYKCTTVTCVEGMREPHDGCGKVRRCQKGVWENVQCRNGMAFVNGECSGTISCRSANYAYQHGTSQCMNQHAKPHYYDCSKYLVCKHGQFVEGSCFNNHQFNPAIGRCDPSYKCKSSYRPDCYENEMKAVVTDPHSSDYHKMCDQYELCVDGNFGRQRCPFGQIFDAHEKRCVDGKCEKPYSEEKCEKDDEQLKYDGSESEGKCMEADGTDGYRADDKNCSKFYQCSNGVWVTKDCPANLAFNSAIGVCDWPHNVPGC